MRTQGEGRVAEVVGLVPDDHGHHRVRHLFREDALALVVAVVVSAGLLAVLVLVS